MQPVVATVVGGEDEKKVDVPSYSALEDTDFRPHDDGRAGGKKKDRNKVKQEKGKDKQKHRKFARLKKLLNVGEKLKPLGLGDSGADYDGQTSEREQGQDDSDVVQADHATQDSSGHHDPAAANLDFAHRNYDLYVQIFEARDLQGRDSNGLSDPYCKVYVGKSKQRTKTIQKCLNPQWDETFHFTAQELKQCMIKSGRLLLELRDRDFLSRDEFLGQVSIDLTKVALDSKGVEDWFDLKAIKHGEMITGLGAVRVGLVLANNDEEEQDPADNMLRSLSQGEESDGRCKSTLCVPRGMVKILPVVIHSKGHCLYEEPCVFYFSLQAGEVRRLSDFAGAPEEAESHVADRKPSKAIRCNEPSGNIYMDTARSSWEMFLHEMQDSTSWHDPDDHDSDDDSEEEGSEEDEGPHDAEDDQDDPFDEDEANIENPLQAPDAEEVSAPASSTAVPHKRLYCEASLGNQRRRSKVARLRDKKFSWNQGLPFAATLPLKDKHFKILLCEMDRDRQETCPIAIAFVSLHRLLKEDSEEGKWYKLHEYGEEKRAKPRLFGAVRLKLQATDSDGRRALYHQPIYPHHETSIPTASGIHAQQETGPSSMAEHHSSPAEDWKAGAENGYDALDQPQKSAPSWKPPSWLGRAEDAVARFHRKEITVHNARGIPRMFKTIARAVLLSAQAVLAICTVFLHLLCYLWQSYGMHTIQLVKNLFTKDKDKEETRETDNDSKQLKPADLALGVVSVVLKDIDLHDQPKGKYYCVFKCGPHWGQTLGMRCMQKLSPQWEIQLPIMEPHTLFSICVFRDMHRKETSNLRSRPPEMVGKLRLRLNTLQAGQHYDCSLPMLGDRKKGGRRNATAHMEIKMVYFFQQPVVKRYFEAAQPYDVYALHLGEGNVAKQLLFEYHRLCLEWLEHTEPQIPKSVAKAVIGSARYQFVFSRAKANWTRFVLEKERFTWIIRFWKRNQAWENPAETICLMCCLITFSFRPQIVLVGLILTLVFYCFIAAQKRPDKPWQMVVDPDDDDEDDEAEEEGGIKQLRQKYFRLVKVALSVQNYLEDFADTLERLHAFINWADPKATLIFIFACLLAAMAIATFSLPVVLSCGLCWTVRPPFLRSPTPPAPLSFFLRLPTRSDQVI